MPVAGPDNKGAVGMKTPDLNNEVLPKVKPEPTQKKREGIVGSCRRRQRQDRFRPTHPGIVGGVPRQGPPSGTPEPVGAESGEGSPQRHAGS